MPVEAPLVDEMALTQQSLRLHARKGPVACRLDHVDQASSGSPFSEAPRPRRHPVHVPEATGFETELFHRWNLPHRPAQREEVPLITTWYNDHDRWPICADPRHWRLSGPAATWREQLLRIWHDHLDPTASTEIYVVDPDPVDAPSSNGGHVILLQHAHPHSRSILVSVLDSLIHSGAPRRWALRSTEDPTGMELVALMGYRYLCPPADPQARCQVWCRRQEIGMDDVVIVRHGLALTLTVLRPSADPEIADDAASFLQSDGFHPSKSGTSATADVYGQERCQTHGLVAHTHGPRAAPAPPPPVQVSEGDQHGLVPSPGARSTCPLSTCCGTPPKSISGHAARDGSMIPQPFDVSRPLPFLPPGPLQMMSWTEEFLRAMRASAVVQDDLPFPAEAPPLEAPRWLQQLWPIWQGGASLGPGGVEFMARVETWYADHRRIQTCYSSRVVILGSDTVNWHQDLARAWADVLDPAFAVEFALIHPRTVDARPQAIAQILLIQRPDPFQRSIIVTVSDTAVQRGLPSSRAVVVADRVRMHGVLLMTDLLYHCPPELLTSRCILRYGDRVVPGDDFVLAAHGDVFTLHIQRDVQVDIAQLLDLPDDQLRQRLATIIQQGNQQLGLGMDIPPSLMATPPDWFNSLDLAFDTYGAIELQEEGDVLYVHTWFLDAEVFSHCPVSHPVRLPADRRQWRSSLLAVWQDHIHPLFEVDITFVHPQPPFLPWNQYAIHLLLSQRAAPDHALVLLSSMPPVPGNPVLLQAMHYLPNRVSTADLVSLILPDLRPPFACRARRHDQVFPAHQTASIANGDSLEIDVMPPPDRSASSSSTDDLALLQTGRPLPSTPSDAPAHRRKVELHLDALLSLPVKPVIERQSPEILFTSDCQWIQRLTEGTTSFAALPEGLHLAAETLHALQEPACYAEPPLAGCLAYYVDGSAFKDAAAWAVVAVSYDWAGIPTLLGVLADKVSTDPSNMQWIGAQSATNIAAEITASIAAHIVALSLPHVGAAVVRPDLHLSAMLSTMQCYCTSHPSLVAVAHWLGAAYHNAGGRCIEVRGHQSHPWNELADRVAKHCLHHEIPIGSSSFDICHQALLSGDLSWAWMHQQDSSFHSCFPPLSPHHSWQVSPSLRRSPSSTAQPMTKIP